LRSQIDRLNNGIILTNQARDRFEELVSAHDLIRKNESDFRVCMCAIRMCRYIIDHRSLCPLSVSARIFRQHDLLVMLIGLINEAPWSRTNRRTGLQEKWKDEWVQYTIELAPVEGSCWLSILALITSEELRSGSYELTSTRVNALLSLRKHLNESLFIQIPDMIIVRKFVDHLSLTSAVGNPTTITNCHNIVRNSLMPFAILELSEGIFDAYMKKKVDWFSAALTHSELVRISAQLTKSFEESLVGSECDKYTGLMCTVCQAQGEFRCSRCKAVVYCSGECQTKDWSNGHKQICRSPKYDE
jgi:hypothetical protein